MPGNTGIILGNDMYNEIDICSITDIPFIIWRLTDNVILANFRDTAYMYIECTLNFQIPDTTKKVYIAVPSTITRNFNYISGYMSEYPDDERRIFFKQNRAEIPIKLIERTGIYELCDPAFSSYATSALMKSFDIFKITNKPIEQIMFASIGMISVDQIKSCIEKGIVAITPHTLHYYATYHKKWLETLPIEKILAGV